MVTARIAITPGDLAGIGPDLCLRLAQQVTAAELVVYSDQTALAARAKHLQLPIQWQPFDPKQSSQPHQPGTLKYVHIPAEGPTIIGQPSPQHAPFLMNTLKKAVTDCQSDICHALVTGPVSKAVINDGGIPFTGHTEYLGTLTASEPVMMLATPQLRVALATTHIPLSAVPSAITATRLTRTIRILHHELIHKFGCTDPTILVCGLNPHAGENGHLGKEDIDIIHPTIKKLYQEGIHVEGPLPADTIFLPHTIQRSDAILAMYHDQGLPVLKYAGFYEAINITLGLPIIRTSVDHGTAFELAGSFDADMGSLRAAIDTAIDMVDFSMDTAHGT